MRHKNVTVKCAQCGKTYEKYIKYHQQNQWLGHKNYCSKECIKASRLKGKEVKCAWCSKEFYAKPSQLKRSKSGKSFCGRSCSNAHRNTLYFGKKHPNYREDSGGYRQKAFDHYGKECSKCSYKKCVSALEVHHKNRNRKDNRLRNLEVLCRNCHAEEHYMKNGV